MTTVLQYQISRSSRCQTAPLTVYPIPLPSSTNPPNSPSHHQQSLFHPSNSSQRKRTSYSPPGTNVANKPNPSSSSQIGMSLPHLWLRPTLPNEIGQVRKRCKEIEIGIKIIV